MHVDVRHFLPLSIAAQHILLALASEDRHGYGIVQEVTRISSGRYKLSSGTLYDNLEKLIEQSLVEEAPHASPLAEPRRRYYRLTMLGRRTFSAEVARLENVVRTARLRLRGARPKEAV